MLAVRSRVLHSTIHLGIASPSSAALLLRECKMKFAWLLQLSLCLLLVKIDEVLSKGGRGGGGGGRSSSSRSSFSSSKTSSGYRYSSGKTRGSSNWGKGGYGNSFSGGFRSYSKSRKSILFAVGGVYMSRRRIKSHDYEDDYESFGEADPVLCYNNVTKIPPEDLELEVAQLSSQQSLTALNYSAYVEGLQNRTSGVTYGLFVCPLDDDNSKVFCCGGEFSEYCCGFWDDESRMNGAIAIVTVGLGFIGCIVYLVIKCC